MKRCKSCSGLTLVVAFILLIGTPVPVARSQAMLEAQPSDSGWRWYEDQQDGYKIQYPAGWTVYPSPIGALPRVTQFYSYSRDEYPAVGMPSPVGETKIEIAVLANESGLSVAEWFSANADATFGLVGKPQLTRKEDTKHGTAQTVVRAQYFTEHGSSVSAFVALGDRVLWLTVIPATHSLILDRMLDSLEWDQAAFSSNQSVSESAVPDCIQSVDGEEALIASPDNLLAQPSFKFPWPNGQTNYYTGGPHRGWVFSSSLYSAVDFGGPARDIRSVAGGRVVHVSYRNDLGVLVGIAHSDGWTSWYAHLDGASVRQDQDISQGCRIGGMGATGTGAGGAVHLHFAVAVNSQHVAISGTSMDGWVFHSSGSEYQGTMTRGSETKVADVRWSSSNSLASSNPDGSCNPGASTSCTDGEGVILYEHSNYQGRCSRFTGDDSYIGDNAIGNDTASSIKIIGNYQAQVFEHSNYGGTSSRFTGDDPDFGNDAIGHDRASSIRVSRRDTGGTSNCDGGQGVYLYEHPNYSGKCSKFTGDSPNPRNWYIGNDTASSIRIIGNYEATVYEHDDYNGASSTFSGDDPDFGNDAIRHDRASSIRVRTRQSGGNSNCDGGAGVYLYEHPNYQGRCSKFTGDSPNPREWYIGNDTASAIKILGNYAATVYEHDNYNGTSSTFVGDDPDFGNDSIGHDRASSIRVRTRDVGPSSCDDGQFLAEYFNNRDLGGNPVFRRCESAVNYNWGGGGPGNGVVNDNFSVRWTGRFWFANDGIYRFTTRTDDGVRLIVDGQMLIQEWRDMAATTFQREKQLSSGMHTVRMEYYEHGGNAVAQLSWQFQSGSASDPDDGRTLSYDFGLDGTINPARDRDDYYFDGSAGQAITLRMDKRDSNIDSYLELYNPDGSLLAQDDDNGGDRNARIAVTLRQNGRHKVIAREYSDRTGGYRISLSRESVADPDDNRWISFGGTLEGTISPNNDEDWYYFSGSSGRSVSIRMNKLDSSLDPYLELYNPNGVKVAYNDDGGGDRNSWIVYTLPVGGTYRIKARSYQLASSGRYRLSLQAHSNANLALNKGAWATSTEFNGVEPHKAFDGNLSTRWSSRFADPQFIYVDLGNVYTFNQVVLKWETAYGRRYGIFYWDGNAWQPIFWTNSGDGGTDTINFNPVRARYVGMYGVERGTPWGYSLWEFEVYDNTALVLPLVPPDPDDKEPDTVPEAAPLAPNDPDKATLLIGEGPEGQENTPLEDQPTDAPTASTDSGRPSAFILYPISTENPAEVPEEILFQGIASDNDEAGESIVEYRWTSSVSGVIGTADLFRLPRTALAQGRHVITFEALDDEGNWSDPETVVLVIGEAQPQKLYLPLISR